jgi:hypothetical protein
VAAVLGKHSRAPLLKVLYRIPTYMTSSTLLSYGREQGLSVSRRKVPAQIEKRIPAVAYKYEAYGWRPNSHICTFSPTILYARKVAETDISGAVQTRDF